MRLRPGGGGEVEAVADLDTLDRLDAHESARQTCVETTVPVDVRAQARRQPVDDHLDDAAEGVAVGVRLLDARDHRSRRVGVEAADRVGVDGLEIGVGGHQTGGGGHAPELDDVGEHLRAGGLLEEGRGHLSERHPGRGLTGRGTLEDRAGLVEGVLLHADEVGVTRARPGECLVAGQSLELDRVDRVGGHHLLPLGPLGVADLDRYRSALGLAVADAADDPDLVLLELHPGTTAVPEPTAREGVGDVFGRHLDVGGQPFEDGDERGSVGLPGGEPAKHGVSVSRAVARIPHGAGRQDTQYPSAFAIGAPANTPTTAPSIMNGPNGIALRSTTFRTASTAPMTPPSRIPAYHPQATSAQPR